MTQIFVFASNLAGRHGRGSAREALLHHGAIYGQGEGLQGNSYAIPTKNGQIGALPLNDPRAVLPLTDISEAIDRFCEFARAHPEMTFNLVEIGCGLAGYQPEQIAPMFRGCGANINLPESFRRILEGEQ